jgi:hypothetical protein
MFLLRMQDLKKIICGPLHKKVEDPCSMTLHNAFPEPDFDYTKFNILSLIFPFKTYLIQIHN